jgi:hypothetical protein
MTREIDINDLGTKTNLFFIPPVFLKLLRKALKRSKTFFYFTFCQTTRPIPAILTLFFTGLAGFLKTSLDNTQHSTTDHAKKKREGGI